MRCSTMVIGCLLLTTAGYGADFAAATPGFYVSALGGGAFVDSMVTTDANYPDDRFHTKTEAGVSVLGAIGYNWGLIRTEGEFGWQESKLDTLSRGTGAWPITGELSVRSIMANAYLDFRGKNVPLVPYLTAGLGYANIHLTERAPSHLLDPSTSDSDGVFAWQIGAGMNVLINAHWAFDVRYRCFSTASPKLGLQELDFRSHNAYMGLQYKF